MYHRLTARRGPGKAGIAVAHAILIIAYYVVKDGTTYQDLGHDFFDQLNRDRVAQKLKKRMEALGYTVTMSKDTPEPPAA